MSKLARSAFVLLIPAAILLAGCTADSPDDEVLPDPSLSIEPSIPSSPPAELPTGDAIADWAAVTLPEDRPGAESPVLRQFGPITRQQGVVADISQTEGLWDLVMTCQSVDGSPLTWHIESPSAATDEPVNLDCTTPNGGIPTTSIVGFDGEGAQLELTATSDAVYAFEVRPHSEPLD